MALRVVRALRGRLEHPLGAEIERAAQPEIDRARDAALQQRGVLRLVDDHRADHLGRQQVEAGAAAHGRELVEDEPVAGRDRVAVDRHLRQAGRGAADADAVILVEAALAARCGRGVEPRQALERVGHVLVGELADVGGRDHLDVIVGVVLEVERLLERSAHARHDDLVARFRVGDRGRRRGLRHGGGDDRQHARRSDQKGLSHISIPLFAELE